MISDEELGRRFRAALESLDRLDVHYRRRNNLALEDHFPESCYNFRIGFDGHHTGFEYHDDGGSGEWDAVARAKREDHPDNFPEEVLSALESAVVYFENLKPKEDD